MATPKTPPIAPGTVMGCFKVVEWLADAPKANARLYGCVTTCCGETVTRTGQALIVSARMDKTLCLHCANTKIFPIEQLVRSGFQPGAVVGPVTILAQGELPRDRLVRWSCCGKTSVIGVKRLRVMRLRAQDGQTCVCRACTDARRKESQARTREPWHIATAVLPPGVIPAAAAWPRPRALA